MGWLRKQLHRALLRVIQTRSDMEGDQTQNVGVLVNQVEEDSKKACLEFDQEDSLSQGLLLSI